MQNTIYKLLITYLLFTSMNLCSAQSPAFYQINEENNLPSNEIYRIVQDRFGYIWIACDAGLYRYDGFNYKQYTAKLQNGRAVSFLQIDEKQRVWCKNFYGQIYRVEGDSLKVMRSFQTSNASYPQFALDKQCNLWFYNRNTLFSYNETDNKTTSYNIEDFSAANEIIALRYFDEFVYVFTHNLNVYQFNTKNKQFKNLNWTLKPDLLSRNVMFCEYRNKLIMLVDFESPTTKYSIYSVDNNIINLINRFENLEKNQHIYSLYADSKNIWVTTSLGAFQVENNQSALFSPQNSIFSKEKISSMFHDREGMYWFSTLQSGLLVIPQIDILKLNVENSVLKENNLTSIAISGEGKLLLGSYLGNIFEFNSTNNELKEVFTDKHAQFIATKYIEHYNDYTVISRGRFCIIENKTGVQYFPRISNIRDFERIGDTLFMVLPENIIKASLSKMVANNGVKYSIVNQQGGRKVECNTETQTLYFAMGSGTFVLKPNGKWSELRNGGEKIYASSLSYSNGIVWMTTLSKGIFGFKDTVAVYHFDKGNLLSENTARIIKATEKNIWFTTDNYLYRINYKTLETSKFNNSQSIFSKDINAIEILNENVYLATKKGLVIVPENLNWKNNIVPNIEITGVYLNDVFSAEKSALNLPFDHSNLKIALASSAFKSKGNYNYQYRLLGLDSAWNQTSAANSAIFFQRIPVGNFELQIRAVNEHGVKSQTVSMQIAVKAPFWRLWWFYLVITVLGSIVVTIVYIWRIRYIQRKAELKSKVIASQLTALKAQMNPHFLFNILNSIQDLIIKNDTKTTNYYLNKFSLLMRKVLDVSDKDKILLAEEIEILDTYLQLEKLRFGADFTFTISVSENIDKDYFALPPMIIQPFVENAIKHGLLHKKGAKQLLISFELNDILVCTITDNGIGRKRMEEIKQRNTLIHKSFATDATAKRIELLNTFNHKKYNFEIIDLEENDVSLGTKVIINFPF